MARWKLIEKHYLKTIPPTEWEQVEQDLTSGEVVRKRFEVAKFLDPAEPKSWNYKETQEIIVCLPGKGQPRDIQIKGNCTVGMEPLDDEAKILSAIETKRGEHPIDSLAVNGAADAISGSTLKTLQAQINTLMLANDELQRRIAEKVDEEPVLYEVQPTEAEITEAEAKVAAEKLAQKKADETIARRV